MSKVKRESPPGSGWPSWLSPLAIILILLGGMSYCLWSADPYETDGRINLSDRTRITQDCEGLWTYVERSARRYEQLGMLPDPAFEKAIIDLSLELEQHASITVERLRACANR